MLDLFFPLYAMIRNRLWIWPKNVRGSYIGIPLVACPVNHHGSLRFPWPVAGWRDWLPTREREKKDSKLVFTPEFFFGAFWNQSQPPNVPPIPRMGASMREKGEVRMPRPPMRFDVQSCTAHHRRATNQHCATASNDGRPRIIPIVMEGLRGVLKYFRKSYQESSFAMTKCR